MPREVLVHLNVEVPDDLVTNVMTAQEIADGIIMPSLEVGLEGSPLLAVRDDPSAFKVVAALVEEV